MKTTLFMKPVIALLFALLTYCLTVVFEVSNILGLICYGLTQERYSFQNIPLKASVLTTNIVSTIALIFETFLFFLLGYEFSSVGFMEVWDFSLATLVLIYFARVIVTCGICYIMNRRRKRPINWKWQVLLIVGGLRGAIAFAMVIIYDGPYHKLYYDTTLIVIIFTTLANGIIAKPLVEVLGLRSEGGQNTDYNEYYRKHLRKPGMIARSWKKLEDKVIFKYIIFKKNSNI